MVSLVHCFLRVGRYRLWSCSISARRKRARVAIATSALRKKARDACAAYIRVSQCGTCTDAHTELPIAITPSYNCMAIYTRVTALNLSNLVMESRVSEFYILF